LNLFEYILVITSVVYALALAQILSGIARLAQSEATVRRFHPHTIWVVVLFISILMFWWAGWEFRAVQWAAPKYLYTMITPIFMFFSVSLIIPARIDDQELNLERHFLKIRRPALWSYFIALLTQFVDGPLLADEPWWFAGRAFQVVVLSVVILAVFTKNRWLQTLSPIGVLLFLTFVSLTILWTPGVIE
jgi:hypothetical protein